MSLTRFALHVPLILIVVGAVSAETLVRKARTLQVGPNPCAIVAAW